MHDLPVGADRPASLFEPVHEMAATPGIFDAAAKWCALRGDERCAAMRRAA
jgi:hypothetical protein